MSGQPLEKTAKMQIVESKVGRQNQGQPERKRGVKNQELQKLGWGGEGSCVWP